MDWEEKKAAILRACGSILEPLGYKFINSRPGFEKKSKSERRGVYLILTRTNHGNYSGGIWCGLRNNVIHELFHRTSGIGNRIPVKSHSHAYKCQPQRKSLVEHGRRIARFYREGRNLPQRIGGAVFGKRVFLPGLFSSLECKPRQPLPFPWKSGIQMPLCLNRGEAVGRPKI